VIPSKFADVNNRFGSPHYSILLLVFLSAGVAATLAFIGATGYAVLFSLGTFLWGGAYVVPMLAAAIFPFVRKDLVPALPGFLKKKILGVTVVTIISVVGVVLSIFEDYLYLANPALNVISISAILGVLGIVILAVLIYYSSVAYHKRHGIDIRQAFKEIPPE
jgi:amino acid transporter